MKLLSGGQSGVDRAVLDVAIERGLAYAGWCPKDGWAEDLPAPPGVLGKYPQLQETPSADPAQRTEWSVRDAEACLVIVQAGGSSVSPGTILARELTQRYGKPLCVADLCEPDSLKRTAAWLRAQRAAFGADVVLGIGGRRESEVPGIYARTVAFLRALIP